MCDFMSGSFFGHVCGNGSNWSCRKIEFCGKKVEFFTNLALSLKIFEFLISDLLNKVAGKLSFLRKVLSFEEKID